MASPTCDTPHVEFVLRLGDSALLLAQRLSGWVGHAPTLEEELALANIALDLLGQATMLLEHAGALEGLGRDADALAYLRDAPDYRNLLLCERPNGDFAHTIVRQLFYEAYAFELWRSLLDSSDETLAGIAGKAIKETRYHLEHVADWLTRLGDGTDESHDRTARAVHDLWPYSGEAFVADAVDDAMEAAGIAPSCATLEGPWRDTLATTFASATLALPDDDAWQQVGGKQGRHTEDLGFVLAELQYLQRTYPGSIW